MDGYRIGAARSLLLSAVLLMCTAEGTAAARKTRAGRGGRSDHDAPAHRALSARPSVWNARHRGTPGARRTGVRGGTLRPRHPAGTLCTENWFEQTLDHFSWANDTRWRQRYFICDNDWQRPSADAPAGPIFFYCGNEGNVESYVEHTGLMYENAKAFGALLIFAEHRYYGESLPLGDQTFDHMQFLTHEQALADYATLIRSLKTEMQAEDADVIAFGGSYGGMLAAWFRLKYPHVVLGSIAASAPILAFPGAEGGEEYASGGQDYWSIVTRDASPAAGSSPSCIPAFRAVWDKIDELANSPDGRLLLSDAFRMCLPLGDPVDVEYLKLYIAMGIDTMAMGNFPYPSDYLTGGNGDLPPWPVRQACSKMEGIDVTNTSQLFPAIRDATAVFYNASGTLTCHELPADSSYDGIWDYQWCTELQCQESYFRRDGIHDMFYPFHMTPAQVGTHCWWKYRVSPRRSWIYELYGGLKGLAHASNIVFSNGGFDPWSFGGVTPKTPLPATADASLAVVWIPEGAHHLDLFFSNPADPASVIAARKTEVAYMRKWLDAAAVNRQQVPFSASRVA